MLPTRINMTADDAHIALEDAVMALLLAGDDPVLGALRAQFAGASVKKRMFSGVGFVTDFNVSEDAAPAHTNSLFFLSDVGADLNGHVKAAFHIQIKRGALKLLEGFTYDDPWPVLTSFDPYYIYPPAVAAAYPNRAPQERLMDVIRPHWA